MVRSVALQRRGVVFMTVLLRNTRTYLVGLRPANLLLLPLDYLYSTYINKVIIMTQRYGRY
jgi:hypothetical protein